MCTAGTITDMQHLLASVYPFDGRCITCFITFASDLWVMQKLVLDLEPHFIVKLGVEDRIWRLLLIHTINRLSIFQFYFQSNRHLDFGVSDFKLLVGSLGQTCCGTEGCTTTAWCISDRRPNWGRNWPSTHHHFQFEFMSRLRDIRPDFVHGEDAVIFEEDIALCIFLFKLLPKSVGGLSEGVDVAQFFTDDARFSSS